MARPSPTDAIDSGAKGAPIIRTGVRGRRKADGGDESPAGPLSSEGIRTSAVRKSAQARTLMPRSEDAIPPYEPVPPDSPQVSSRAPSPLADHRPAIGGPESVARHVQDWLTQDWLENLPHMLDRWDRAAQAIGEDTHALYIGWCRTRVRVAAEGMGMRAVRLWPAVGSAESLASGSEVNGTPYFDVDLVCPKELRVAVRLRVVLPRVPLIGGRYPIPRVEILSRT